MTKPTVQYTTFEELLQRDGYLVYTNVGTSMLPLLRQRKDLIEIRKKDPDKRCRKYEAVLYKRGQKYILHRILKVRPRDYVIVGDHCIWPEYGITDNQILGVMTRVIRDGKPINCTDWKYRLYVCTLLIPFILLETIVTNSMLTLLTTQHASKSETRY